MTTKVACANCHHEDHHGIGSADGKRLGETPCFRIDFTQKDGFCPCQRYRLPRTAEEFATSYLGPETPATGHTWEGHDDRD